MIDNGRVSVLSEEHLEQLSFMCDEFDCHNINCNKCPFQLAEQYSELPYVGRCALAYAKVLYRRMHG